MTSPPVASVLIPTRNRKDLLLRAVSSALSQSVPVEVLVMEDAGSDGTGQALREAFPQVRHFRSEVPRGPTWQRNEGARQAKTEYLVTLDDDCEFVSSRTIEQALAELDHPRIAGVTLPFVNVRQGATVHTRAPGPGRFVTFIFLGGMVCLRREPFLRVGGYRTELFIHVEEPDLAVRLLAAGYLIRLGTADPLHHHESPLRDSTARYLYGARNNLLYVWFNAPWPRVVAQMAATTASQLLFGVRERRPILVGRGLGRGWRGVLSLRRSRAPVPPWAFALARELRDRGHMPWNEVVMRLGPAGETHGSGPNSEPV